MIAEGGGLPAQTSRFFGRSQEAAAVKGALSGARLVTLTGPGGIGKTRLAVRVAGEVAPLFPDGIFVADLSAARDAADVARTVTSALGLAAGPDNVMGPDNPAAPDDPAAPDHPAAPDDPAGGQRAAASLASSLGPRQMLLILDTAEHVVDACAELADAILRGGDGPVLLVTSRQVLDLPGEMVFRIPPLAVDADAVRLFADRAAAAVPGFELGRGTRPKVVRLCRLLDGIPLAIELAALRLRAVSLDELLARLPGQLRLLTSGRRAAAGDRQQSLGASVSWSYELCTPAERLLWTRLSAFRDGFDLTAAEAVCGTVAPGEQADLSAPGVLDTLVGLVDKSVVLRTADTGGTARYRLFAAAAEHGAEHAADAAVRAVRHRAHYRGVARAFAASFAGPGQAELVDRLTPDQANLRLAFDGTLAAGDTAAALELATACWPWLVCTDRLAEAGTWLARALGQAGGAEPGSPPAATAPSLPAWLLAAQDDIAGAATGLAPAAVPAVSLAAGLAAGFAALRRGALADCAARCDELTAALPPGERWARGWAAWAKGVTAWLAGDRPSSGRWLGEGLELLAPFGGELAAAQHLEALGWLAAGRGDYRQTARLQGAADAVWQRLVLPAGARAPRFGLVLLDAERDRAEREARDVLGEAGYAAEHAAGGTRGTAAAIASEVPGAPPLPSEAAGLPPVGPDGTGPAGCGPGPFRGRAVSADAARAAGEPARAEPASRWELLTAREREVAGLVAAGLTNKGIAARLVVSKRTVDAHLEHILGKLAYNSRVQVAALASRELARERLGGEPG